MWLKKLISLVIILVMIIGYIPVVQGAEEKEETSEIEQETEEEINNEKEIIDEEKEQEQEEIKNNEEQEIETTDNIVDDVISKEVQKLQETNDTEKINEEIQTQELNTTNTIEVQYQDHRQYTGWQDWKKQGELAGTQYQGIGLEGIKIRLVNAPANAKVEYQALVQTNNGKQWQNWVSNGELAGTEYAGKNMHAIKIRLVNLENYTIEYKTHIQNMGWSQDWKEDGELSGTEYTNNRIEGMLIRIVPKKQKTLKLEYQDHREYTGWQDWKNQGELAGTQYQGIGLEGIKIRLVNAPANAKVEYQALVQTNNGKQWQNWVSDGELAGTEFIGKNMYAIKIRLVNMDNYTIEYKSHIQNMGWLQDWKEDGELSGTEYTNNKIEGMIIRIVPKKEKKLKLEYQDHREYTGWQDWKNQGELLGTQYQGIGLEGIKIRLVNAPEDAKVEYQALVETNSGKQWQAWVSDGNLAGTQYIGKKMYAIRIRLVNMDEYTIEYRTHIQNKGWAQNWREDGEVSGTEYTNNRIEGMQIRLIPKKQKSLEIHYQPHVEGYGWQDYAENSETVGEEYQGVGLEGIKIKLENAPTNASVEYQAHVETDAWKSKVSENSLAGTEYKGKRLEGIRIRLKNLDEYSVQYRARVEGQNWQQWVCDGELAGTEGQGKKMEALQIRIVAKIYNTKIVLEQPKKSNLSRNEVDISGWELSGLEGTYIRVYMNDRLTNSTVERQKRDDILNYYFTEDNYNIKADYGTRQNNATPGFKCRVNTSGLANGIYTLTVKVFSKENNVLKQVSKRVIIYDCVYEGIDVSQFQKTIDWSKVKDTGLDYTMIRIGYRGYGTGKIVYDPKFVENITGASLHQIPVGIYFFTQAVSEQEAIEEANWVINALAMYRDKIKYPIAIDTEWSNDDKDGRADWISNETRTAVCRAFCNRIRQAGYTPMIYASKNWIQEKLDINQLGEYEIWLAHYTYSPEKPSDYTGPYTMWQYTSSGYVNGISGNVDMNLSYRRY